MSDEMQALCFLTGANSIFTGDVRLTANSPEDDADARLFAKLGLKPEPHNLSTACIEAPTRRERVS